MRWSLFCRVVDNFGDIGFAWRLAADLVARGERVRLAVDDASALAWMAPGGDPRIAVVPWDDAASADAEVLVETFGCGLPDTVRARLEHLSRLPVLVNVEHLSAESYVERSHGLPSPRFLADGRALPTWYFYPGFTPATGGLLREPGLRVASDAFGDGRAWLAERGIERRPGERCVSLFCYPNTALDALLDALSIEPTLLLLTPGHASNEVAARLGPGLARKRLRALPLPALSQSGFDRLLWACDLNLVRGEDSLVRAIWAGRPFLWQAYVQAEAAHRAKVEALLERMLAGVPAALGEAIRAAFIAWNGGADGPLRPTLSLPALQPWAGAALAWRDRVAALPDLTTRLLAFVSAKG